MALGGYKFVGYKYTRPADYDSSVDAQVLAETLKMHKCKLKAFTESCAASGAQWDFSYNAGDYAFGTHGNVIYKMDSSGFNLVSFFRYGTDDAYYAIVTLSDVSTGTGYSLKLVNFFKYFSGSTFYQSVISNDMSCLSLIDLNMENINVYPTVDRLALSSDDLGYVITSTTAESLSKSIPEYKNYGYATKGKCIISLLSPRGTATMPVKISAVDLLKLSSPDDTKNLFSYTCYMTTSTGTPYYSTGVGYIQSLTDVGIPYERCAISSSNVYTVELVIQSPKIAVSYNPTNNIPYEAAVIIPIFKSSGRPNDQPLNRDGIMTKGEAPIDMMATNIIYPYNNIIPQATYANGNYLNVWKYVTSNYGADSSRLGKIFYIGWDPSNPDITQESAWTAYTG